MAEYQRQCGLQHSQRQQFILAEVANRNHERRAGFVELFPFCCDHAGRLTGCAGCAANHADRRFYRSGAAFAAT